MTERPIIFSAPMVRALLGGTKTQTRRPLKASVPDAPGMNEVHPLHKPRHPAPYLDSYCSKQKNAPNPRGMSREWCWWTRDDRCAFPRFTVPYQPGDRLWVRETWKSHSLYADRAPWNVPASTVIYAADDRHPFLNPPWHLAIHMPRWASRLTLLVTDVRVQRVQEISEADAEAEGAPRLVCDDESKFYEHPAGTYRTGFAGVWAHIHGADTWDSNPWVVALTFAVERKGEPA